MDDAAEYDFHDNADPILAEDMAAELNAHGDADVTVYLADTFLDVCRVTYHPRRERFALHLHPDDVADVLSKLVCRRS